MKLFFLACKNLKQNYGFYLLYFLSVTLVLAVYSCFKAFSMNTLILEKISEDGRVEAMTSVVSVILMAFVLFYMVYSNSFFTKRRMGELGVYALLGFRKTRVMGLLFFENLLIISAALLSGLFIGSLLHKGVVLLLSAFLDLKIDLSSVLLFNPDALLQTTLFIAAVLLFLLLSNGAILRKVRILSMVRLEKKSEKPLKLSPVSAGMGLVFLASGYGLAFNITAGVRSLWVTVGFLPMAGLTFLLVTIGTVFFIRSFLPFGVQSIRRCEKWFYRPDTIVVLPKFVHRIRSNARMLILLTLLSAATLGILGSTLCTYSFSEQGLSRITPAALEFPGENQQKVSEALDLIRRCHAQEDYQVIETRLLLAASDSPDLPDFEYARKNNGAHFALMRQSDYNRRMTAMKKPVILSLSQNEAVLVRYLSGSDPLAGTVYDLTLPDGATQRIQIDRTTLENATGFANEGVGTLIVSDALYAVLAQSGLEAASVVSIFGGSLSEDSATAQALAPLFEGDYRFASACLKKDEFLIASSPNLLLTAFGALIFFIAMGCILYFKSLSDTRYDLKDFEILKKLGYQKKALHRIIGKQNLILFSIPCVLGGLHSFFALQCYNALMPQIISGTALLQPFILSYALYLLVFALYYILTQLACCHVADNA
ncbi:FtsX-like permease family protein [Eubacterium sp. 1001713B170207_170306_E7]|uniref:FtsX-like permease family protein n=1 Tax=Eubacterium sp. 1001713B170207_170306_E7 TaxID=2787097 RepID=UPI00189A7938|nr:FtsX-like permease family protein [Eubacterium sp. 1001713B170207_170306_E7]